MATFTTTFEDIISGDLDEDIIRDWLIDTVGIGTIEEYWTIVGYTETLYTIKDGGGTPVITVVDVSGNARLKGLGGSSETMTDGNATNHMCTLCEVIRFGDILDQATTFEDVLEGQLTHNEIFDWLAPEIPNVGDTAYAKVLGGVDFGGDDQTVFYIRRYSSSEIRFYNHQGSILTVTDGSGTLLRVKLYMLWT